MKSIGRRKTIERTGMLKTFYCSGADVLPQGTPYVSIPYFCKTNFVTRKQLYRMAGEHEIFVVKMRGFKNKFMVQWNPSCHEPTLPE